jgi:hypothetical protein
MNYAVKKTNARAALVMYGLASVLAVAAIILQIKSFVAPTDAGGSGNLTSLFFVLAVAAVAMGLIADTAGQNDSFSNAGGNAEDFPTLHSETSMDPEPVFTPRYSAALSEDDFFGHDNLF